MGASEESLRPIVVLVSEYTLELRAKGKAVDTSRSKAESCSCRRFSTSSRSAPGSPVPSNRRQRQISFRNHLISLNVSSIEVITDIRPRSIKHGDRLSGRCLAPHFCRIVQPRTYDFPPVRPRRRRARCVQLLPINITRHRTCDNKSRQSFAVSRRPDRVSCTISALHKLGWPTSS